MSSITITPDVQLFEEQHLATTRRYNPTNRHRTSLLPLILDLADYFVKNFVFLLLVLQPVGQSLRVMVMGLTPSLQM
jgi:hypothetical protein